MKYLMPITMVTALLNGCASLKDSVILGVGVGAVTGTGIGFAVEQSAGSALIGTGIVAVMGATLGYLGHKDRKKKEALLTTAGRKDDLSKDLPFLKAPVAHCVKVAERIENDLYVGEHLRCRIETPAVWSR